MRRPTEQEYSHERLGERFETALSQYDTARRVDTLIDVFLADEMIVGKKVLDVGCGLGYFSERLMKRGATVTASDLGRSLVETTVARTGCTGIVADALCLEEAFGAGSFDAIVSSECIEHTPDPRRAVQQMAAVLKPGGWLSISTPNVIWYPVVRTATLLNLRPFDGHENFSSFAGLRETLRRSRMRVVREKGLHLWPFQLPLHSLSTWADEHLQMARGVMINICMLAQKQH